jgi:uncharacterized protein YbjQ (UPF0145 family)
MRKYLVIFLIGMFVYGCAPFVPVIEVSKVPKQELQQAYKIKTYMVGSEVSYPEVSEYMGDITAYSCKNLATDLPASKGDALTQLRLKALEMEANGIIDVTFDSRGKDAWGTNCWESVQASGIAVKFKRTNKN